MVGPGKRSMGKQGATLSPGIDTYSKRQLAGVSVLQEILAVITGVAFELLRHT